MIDRKRKQRKKTDWDKVTVEFFVESTFAIN